MVWILNRMDLISVVCVNRPCGDCPIYGACHNDNMPIQTIMESFRLVSEFEPNRLAIIFARRKIDTK